MLLALESESREMLLALVLGENRSAGSTRAPALPAAPPLDTVASESLRADSEPSRVRRGWASTSILEPLRLPVGGLHVELVVDTSEATDALSASARSPSDASPSRARRSSDVLVGRGRGSVLDLAAAPGAGGHALALAPLPPSARGRAGSSAAAGAVLPGGRQESVSWSDDSASEPAERGPRRGCSSSVSSARSARPRPPGGTNCRPSPLEHASPGRAFVFFSTLSLAPEDDLAPSLEGEAVEHLSL